MLTPSREIAGSFCFQHICAKWFKVKSTMLSPALNHRGSDPLRVNHPNWIALIVAPPAHNKCDWKSSKTIHIGILAKWSNPFGLSGLMIVSGSHQTSQTPWTIWTTSAIFAQVNLPPIQLHPELLNNSQHLCFVGRISVSEQIWRITIWKSWQNEI